MTDERDALQRQLDKLTLYARTEREVHNECSSLTFSAPKTAEHGMLGYVIKY